ncbi:Ig-like domain-containing protein, partial [Chloroflexota bacterium]
DTFSITVRAQCGTQGVDGISAFIDYDPTYLKFRSFTVPAETPLGELLQEKADIPGEADYTRVTLGDPVSGTFDLVTLTFEALKDTPGTPLDFHTVVYRETFVLGGGGNAVRSLTGAKVAIAPAFTSLAVIPVDPTIAPGQTQEFEAIGNYEDTGRMMNATNFVGWSSSNEAVATIQTTGEANPGLATGLSTGTTVITATLVNKLYGTTVLTVTGVEVEGETETEGEIEGDIVTPPVVVEPDIDDVPTATDVTGDLSPAAFVTSDLKILPSEINANETVTISALVTNTGDVSGSYQVTLMVNEVALDIEAVTLDGGASKTVTFTLTRDISGKYDVSIDNLRGTFTVKAIQPKTTKWPLLGGIIAVVVVLAGLIIYLARRR